MPERNGGSELNIPLLESTDREKIEDLFVRAHATDKEILSRVEKIVSDVRAEGLAAVIGYTERFDGTVLTEDNFAVSREEIERAYQIADPEIVTILTEAAHNIRGYHEKQRRQSWMDPKDDGSLLGQMIRPLSRVGCYVPGGTASYPSSVLMTVIPATVAGVEEIIVVSPPARDGSLNPYTLVAADLAGASAIYKVGGAQAVAALAYGAGPLGPVDKIVGPGNIYVTVAKKLVYGDVGIDMLAGPSEILVVADKSADPDYVAADLLSQAEHDPLSCAILVTDQMDLAIAVREALKEQLAKLDRRQIAKEALENHGALIVTGDLHEALALANRFAPEHLELALADPYIWLGRVKNAGAVFMGHFTPEPVGDYWAGANHVLPTSGTARFYSPLNLDTYMKKISVISLSREALLRDGDKIVKLARTEGLDAHGESVRLRLEKEGNL